MTSDIKTSTGYEPKLKSYNTLNMFRSFNITPFDGSQINYFNYVSRMTSFFTQVDLKEIVDAGSLEEAKKLKEFEEKDSTVKFCLFASLGETPMRRVNQYQYGWEVWNRITLDFNRQDIASKFETWSKLMSYKYRGNGIETHCDEVASLFELLEAKKMKIDEDFKVCALLYSFPAQYGTLVTALQTVSDKLTMAEVRTRAITEESKMRLDGQDMVLYSANRSRPRGAVPPRGEKRKAFTKKFKPRGSDDCLNCGRKGHWKRDCPYNDMEMAAVAFEADAGGLEPSVKKRAIRPSSKVVSLTEMESPTTPYSIEKSCKEVRATLRFMKKERAKAAAPVSPPHVKKAVVIDLSPVSPPPSVKKQRVKNTSTPPTMTELDSTKAIGEVTPLGDDKISEVLTTVPTKAETAKGETEKEPEAEPVFETPNEGDPMDIEQDISALTITGAESDDKK
jgi:hypothetical protein